MKRAKIKREMVGLFMESPLYFTMPLRERLELLNSFSQKAVCQCLGPSSEPLVKVPGGVPLVIKKD